MNKKFLGFFLFLSMLLSNNVYSQINTDRPDQTESSLVLNEGHLQIETGISIEKEKSNINSLFRLGIIDGVELRINSNYLMDDQISKLKNSSFTDFEIGAKFRIQDNIDKKTKIGFLTHISIPTAPEVFSYNEYGFLNRLLVSYEINETDQLGYNIGYNKFKNYNGEFIYTIAYSKGFNSFGVFLELFGNESTDISLINFDSGITYQLDNNNQFDLSFARGLNNDLFNFSIGYSIDIN